MSAPESPIAAARRLIRHELIAPAAERLRAAEREHEAAVVSVQAAEHALETARRTPELLWRRAVESAPITDSDIDANFDAEARAAHRLGFRRRLVDHLAEKVVGAQREVDAARDEAHLPVLLRAAERRIAAAARAEKARAAAGRRENTAELAAARAEFEAATATLAIVTEGCTLLRGMGTPAFGLSAAQEARQWRTFLPADKAAA